MELKDLFLTPLYLLLIYGIAYWVRPKVTNKFTRKYFIPALTVKLIGAIALGLIYQFYYDGGDTFNYFNQSKIVYKAFSDSPVIGFKLLFSNGEFDSSTYTYASRIYWYKAESTFFIVKLTAFFSLFCFNTYSVVALYFAVISFIGLYALYLTLLKISPNHYKEFAVALFFIPSLFFWGSGIAKDTVCVGALGLLFWAFYQLFVEKRKILISIIYFVISLYVIKVVKTYIILCFIPAAVLWVLLENSKKIKNKVISTLFKPVLIGVGIIAGYYGSTMLTADDERYSIDRVARTAAITSNYLERRTLEKAGTGRRTGSEYYVGKLDGSIGSMISAAPQAVFVSLYRPFLFEVRNPVMLLSALECTWLIFLTLAAIVKIGFLRFFRIIAGSPFLTFCIVFSIIFGLGVGLTSGNFGSLVRYRIPLLPFFVSALLVLKSLNNKKKKSLTSSVRTPPSLNPV